MNKNKFILLFLLFTTKAFSYDITEQETSSFFDNYQEQTMFFDSKGAIDFEYICEEPINTIDCRSENVGYLREITDNKFYISNLVYKDDKAFFELTFDQGVYYIDAKRLINGLNITNFYTSKDLYNENLKDDDSTDPYLKFGNIFLIKKPVKLCGDYFKLYSCDLKFETKDNFLVKIIDFKTLEGRKIINLFLIQEHKNFWVDEYILKAISEKK